MKKKIAILLEFGFHEIKKYIHSGFANKLGEQFDIVWITIDKGSKEFENYFISTGYPLVYFISDDFKVKESKIEVYNQSVRRSWMVINNLGAFHNHTVVRKKGIKSLIAGNWLFKTILEKVSLRIIKKKYLNDKLSHFFKENKIDHLLGTSYSSPFSKAAFVTANNVGLKVHYLVNSWKDLFVDNFLPFNFFASIFVWSETMKNDYLKQMPYLDKKKIFVSGNPSFDLLKSSQPKFTSEYYCTKYNINSSADWLLYTMMPPGLIVNEVEIVLLIAEELAKKFSREEKIILLRKNPNHSNDDFVNIEFPNNVVLVDHFCFFDQERDMIVQTAAGEQEWIDLLHFSQLNLSIPSTVTLEFLIFNKPVLNIGFGADGKKEKRLDQHFNAGFYKPMFKLNNVFKVMDIHFFLTAIEKVEEKKGVNSFKFDFFSEENDLASNLIIKKLINSAV